MLRVRSSSVLLAVAALGVASCRSLLDNDELTFTGSGTGGAGGAPATTTTTSTSGATSSASTGTGGTGGTGGSGGGECCVAGEMRDCPCGCPSLFPGGAYETQADVDAIDYSCNDVQTLTMDTDGCHALTFDMGTGTYCDKAPMLGDVIEAGGQCVYSRFRARSTMGSPYIVLEVQNATTGLEVLNESFTSTWTARDNECAITAPFAVEKLFVNVFKGDADATVDIDYIEVFIAPCSNGMVAECPVGT